MHRYINRQIDRQQTDRGIDRRAEIDRRVEIDGQAGRRIDRHTYIQIDKQTDR